MLNKVFILGLLASTCLVFVTAHYPIVFACEKDSSCSSGHRRVYCGYSGFSESECATDSKPCLTSFAVSVNAVDCQKDTYGDSCGSGVCEEVADVNMCTDYILKHFGCMAGKEVRGTCDSNCGSCGTGHCLRYSFFKQCYPFSRCNSDKFHAKF